MTFSSSRQQTTTGQRGSSRQRITQSERETQRAHFLTGESRKEADYKSAASLTLGSAEGVSAAARRVAPLYGRWQTWRGLVSRIATPSRRVDTSLTNKETVGHQFSPLRHLLPRAQFPRLSIRRGLSIRCIHAATLTTH